MGIIHLVFIFILACCCSLHHHCFLTILRKFSFA